MHDSTDIEILKLLCDNARLQWQEVGERVHLSGQAVKNRINKLEAAGIIEGYTLKLNESRMGLGITAFVTIFMKTLEHSAFQSLVIENIMVLEAHKISGNGCYMLKIAASSQKELLDFVESLLKYGNYSINISIERFK